MKYSFLIILLIAIIFGYYKFTQQPKKVLIIIGGGLSGLSSAIESLERGINVILIEKESKMGGNSAKASSGLNVQKKI